MKQDMCWSGELIFPFSKKEKILNFIFGMGGGVYFEVQGS